jgi:hypothetical protein
MEGEVEVLIVGVQFHFESHKNKNTMEKRQ